MAGSGRTEAAARYLLERRAGAAREPAFPAPLAPADEAAAYAIQEEVVRGLGARIGGWKASLLTRATGHSAPLFADALHDSPARLRAAHLPTRSTRAVGIEPEIAFRLHSGLPPRADGAAHSRAAVIDVLGSAHAVIELCVCRFEPFSEAPALDRLADGLLGEALVIGPPQPNWRVLEIARLPLRVRINGEVAHDARGGHGFNDPLGSVVWLANHLAARGRALAAGDIVTTGSCAGIRFVTAGTCVDVEFGGLGAASLELN
ncbi:MAG: fumarylacetoacetate hydrolase family protein [Gammaproteobacteria bacterium]|nr:fumarylacetoacetate hydrolase family protein [Gammaproteobacteria bacterium]